MLIEEMAQIYNLMVVDHYVSTLEDMVMVYHIIMELVILVDTMEVLGTHPVQFGLDNIKNSDIIRKH